MKSIYVNIFLILERLREREREREVGQREVNGYEPPDTVAGN